MRNILVPIDGTRRSDAAVQSVIRQARLGQIGAIHLVNVQPRRGSAMRRFLHAAVSRRYDRERGEKALTRAKRLLDEAGVTYQPHIYTGDVVETIARAAKKLGADEIVMSASNLGVVGSLERHSVVGRVLRRANLPVSVVNYPANDMALESAPAAWQLRSTP